MLKAAEILGLNENRAATDCLFGPNLDPKPDAALRAHFRTVPLSHHGGRAGSVGPKHPLDHHRGGLIGSVFIEEVLAVTFRTQRELGLMV